MVIDVDNLRKGDLSDVLVALVFLLGIFFSPALPLVVFVLLVRGLTFDRDRFEVGYALMLVAASWAFIVISKRGTLGAETQLLQYLYIWLLPFFFLLYAPTKSTHAWVGLVVICLFFLDLSFNFYTVLVGADVLGRVVDERSSVFGVRAGGIFAHAFYSGSISIVAASIFYDRRAVLLVFLAGVNLLFAGSWRFSLLLPLMFFFGYFFASRSRVSELLLVALFSVMAVILVVITSVPNGFTGEANGANLLRVFAWINALDVISGNPLLGGGYPSFRGHDGMSDEVISENLISESWYLNAAVTFGIPYLLFRLLGVLFVIYGHRFYKRGRAESFLVPLVLVDLAYGGFFEAALPYFVLCMLWASADEGGREYVYRSS